MLYFKRLNIVVFSILFILSNTSNFDFDNGYSPIDVIVPTIIPLALNDISKGGSDATLVLRLTTLVTNAWFDAIAPYHPTAIGVYTQHSHRLRQITNKNKNIALFYASYHVLCSLMPKRKAEWDNMLKNVGLDPMLDSSDVKTPEGLGIIAGKKVASVRQQDGMNQLGDVKSKISKRKYNRFPYSDYTGYVPKNTPYEITSPSNWQPAIVSDGNGLFKSQCFVTPQMRLTLPYSYKDPKIFSSPKPVNSDINNFSGYLSQALDIISTSANLDTQKKLRAQFFDNKFFSLGFSILHTTRKFNLTLEEFVHLDFLTNVAAYDTAIAVWQQKAKHDAPRPFTAINYLWKDQKISSWGGPGQGYVFDMTGDQWKSYLNTADHPEYPSGSASFCAAHSTSARKFLKTDQLGFVTPVAKGMSNREPGVTPAYDTNVEFRTWTEFNNDCGASRVWGGVHFPDSVTAGRNIGSKIGQLAYDFVMSHINGTVKDNN